jgi:glycosyltransferase involved in cell wall biosynthesis
MSISTSADQVASVRQAQWPVESTVSVIIPAYNSAKTMAACLEAIHAQTAPVAEIIVADDASTDDTRDIARRHGARVLGTDRNQGPSASRNRGIRAATGDILFFLDSDCAPEADALAGALTILREQPDVACVHGLYSTTPLFDDGPVEAYRLLHNVYWRRRHLGRVRTTLFAVCAIRRTVFDTIGLFDERLRDSEDVELGDRMGDRWGIVLTDTVVCRHDDDSRLGAMLRKQFRRSQMTFPVAFTERGPAGIRANSTLGLAAAALALASAPLIALAPAFAAVPAVFLALFVLADPGLVRFVRSERGTAFTGFFLGVHLLLQWAIAAGAVVGLARWIVDRDFGPARSTAAIPVGSDARS